MSDPTPSTPQTDADRIRLRRLAKLQSAEPSPSPSPSTASVSPVPSQSTPKTPAATKATPVKKPMVQQAPIPIPAPIPVKKKAPPRFDNDVWSHEAITTILKVTLKREAAESSNYDLVWLKSLAADVLSEQPGHALRLSPDMLDQLVFARMEIDPSAMSDDLEYMSVLASLPPQQTTFEFLVGCWKRVNSMRSALLKKGYTPVDTQTALDLLERLRDLVISYAGFILQDPTMFPQPAGREAGYPELVATLISLSTFSSPLFGSADTSPNTLDASNLEQFLQDLARRFEPDNEIDGVLGNVVVGLLRHPSIFRPQGIGSTDGAWRGVVGGIEALVSVKAIAAMITRLPEWNPTNATAPTFELLSLMGPICRLGVFPREWPSIAQTCFADAGKRPQADVESYFASLRGTLKTLQTSLFQVFNTIVRASPESREAVLQYFARVISLNVKRAGMQVDPLTVSSDSFMVNIQCILLRFAENFIDPGFTKLDRIDPFFYFRSERIDITEETRIKATSDEASEWSKVLPAATSPPNFVSNIFYLTVATMHYGILHTISDFNDLGKQVDDMQRHLDMMNGDGSWQGTPMQSRVEAAIERTKSDMEKIQSLRLAYQAQLLDPELMFQSIGFANFLSVWLIRQADPRQKHPNPLAELPLPKEVPMSFRVLPEYLVEDIVDNMLFAVQNSPEKFELSGKHELLIFILTFLSSTWYIKNPFLKSKILDVLFISVWGYGRERNGVLGGLLNTHPLALRHLMPALMQFYIEVEQTGASSQFYDKFNARRSISYILKVVWDNPTHREALDREAKNVDKFVRFINLMINDVTYLMDESLGELAQIHTIQEEMASPTWAGQTVEHRREREGTLRGLERHASSYISLGRTTVELLKTFTAETKAPFMMPEIVDRLAAMLDYNLVALVGPKYNDLRVREPDKLKFNPKELLSNIIQVYLNLSDQEGFVKAVAGDGRSYSRELFERAIAKVEKTNIKSPTEIEQLRAFVELVEVAKATLQAEEDLGEIPDEFLDPLMFTLMVDPVILPTSRTTIDRATIKSHLLSDTKDPFNRAPLAIEDVVPDTELKARIDAFLVERRNKGGDDVAMSDP